MPEPTFKPYCQNQLRLLPLDLSDMVPENRIAPGASALACKMPRKIEEREPRGSRPSR